MRGSARHVPRASSGSLWRSLGEAIEWIRIEQQSNTFDPRRVRGRVPPAERVTAPTTVQLPDPNPRRNMDFGAPAAWHGQCFREDIAKQGENEGDAIRIANDTNFGLHAFVSGTDVQRARRVASQILAGRVAINGMLDDQQAPFGGFKHSGIGREFGTFGIEAFLEPKAILE